MPGAITGTVVAPLPDLLVGDMETDQYSLGDGMSLARFQVPDLDEHQVEFLGDDTISELRRTQWCLRFEYEPEITIRLGEREAEAVRRILLASLAIWIAVPGRAGVPYVFHYRSDDSDGLPHTIKRFDDRIRAFEGLCKREFVESDVAAVQRIVSVLVANYGTKAALDRAVQYLTVGLWSAHVFPRVVMLVTVLEALFGTDNQEISHKLAERYAYLMGAEATERRVLYREMKKIYSARSTIVHGAGAGSRKKKKIDLGAIGMDLEDKVNTCLRRVLLDDGLTQVFCGSDTEREKFLNDLLFQ